MRFLFRVIFYSSFVLSMVCQAKTVKDSLDITMKNLKGHESLYNEGWFVVTSTKGALDYAQKNQMKASEAMSLALKDIKSENKDLSSKIDEINVQTNKEATDFKESETNQTKFILKKTHELGIGQSDLARENFKKAYASLTLGYIGFQKRTIEDWEAIKSANSNFFKRTMHPLSDPEMRQVFSDIFEEADKKSEEGLWSKSFLVAKQDLKSAYNESGEQENSIGGSWSMIKGYFASIYDGLISPTGQSVVESATKAGPFLLGGLITVVKVSGDIVYTTGTNLYYTTKLGYKVISPVVEGGFLVSMALVSTASVPVIYASGTSLGVINQVAVTTATPLVGTGQYVVATTSEGAKYAAVATYDLAKGTGEALVHESTAAVVLGYNMLTAIPAQTLLAAANGVVFLTYDGPKLGISYIEGEIDGVPINQAPVGTVMNVKELEKRNIKLKKLTDDPKVIQKVLESASKDLKK